MPMPTPAVACASLSEPIKTILIVSMRSSTSWLRMAGSTTAHSLRLSCRKRGNSNNSVVVVSVVGGIYYVIDAVGTL